VHKLEEELKFEQENDEGDLAGLYSRWAGKSTWQVQDQQGEKEVKLHRTINNEKITIVFSTDSIAEHQYAEAEEDGDEEFEDSIVVNCTVLVTKQAGKDVGTLEFGVVIDGGEFSIETVNYGRDSNLMHQDTAEADWKRKGQYGGPTFDELDDDLQDLFGVYLKERGFDSNLASFIVEYLELKEQKAYEQWLSNVKSFLSA